MLRNMPNLSKQRLEIKIIKNEDGKIYNNFTLKQTQGNKSEMNIGSGLPNGSENMEIIIMPKNQSNHEPNANPPSGLLPLKERMWSLINTLKDFCLLLLGSLKEETVIQKFWDEFYVLKHELFKVKELFDEDQKDIILKKHDDMKKSTIETDVAPEVCVLNRSINFFQKNTFVAKLTDDSNLQIEKNLNEQKIIPIPIQGSLNGNINASISSLVFVPSTDTQNLQPYIPEVNLIRKTPVRKRKYIPKRKLKIQTDVMCKKPCVNEKSTKNKTVGPEAEEVVKEKLKKKATTTSTKTKKVEQKANGKELPDYKRDESGKRILNWATKEEADRYRAFRVPHPEWEFAFKCNLCDHMYKKWYDLRMHDLKTHTKTFLKQCTICGIRTTCMRAHMRIHNKERNYSCDFCGASFIQAGHLKTHVAHITACRFPSFECNLCNERFMTEKEYGNHFKEKHLNKKIICDLCGDEVCEKCVEDKHQVTLLKLYKCKFCEESFTFNRDYKYHIKEKHTLEISKIWLKCPECPKYFAYHDALQRHKDKFHGDARCVLCEYCSQTFTVPDYLKKHIISNHLNQNC